MCVNKLNSGFLPGVGGGGGVCVCISQPKKNEKIQIKKLTTNHERVS